MRQCENSKRAREIWPKIVKIIEFWKGIPKKARKGKIGANTSYDHLCSIQKDPLVPLKLQFFENIAKTLNSFLVLYQTDKPIVPFLAESLETRLRSLCATFIRKKVLETFIRKNVLESAKTASLHCEMWPYRSFFWSECEKIWTRKNYIFGQFSRSFTNKGKCS